MIDFQIAEALVVKDSNAQIEAEKKREREDWKKGHRQMGE